MALKRWCDEHSFSEFVRSPTRQAHLLDLVLSDLGEQISVEVHPEIADHRAVLTKLHFAPISVEKRQRTCWHYSSANWKSIRRAIAETDWNWISNSSPNSAAQTISSFLRFLMNKHIAKSIVDTSAHSWMDERCLDLVATKCASAGTDNFPHAVRACSIGLTAAFRDHIKRTRTRLQGMQRGSKMWW